MTKPLFDDLYPGRRKIATCLWCGTDLVDGADVSGFTGEGPDYMSRDGDFGCDRSPDSGPDSVGAHTPDRFVTWDDHVIRVTAYDVRRHVGHGVDNA